MREPQWFLDWRVHDVLSRRVYADNPECLQALEMTERSCKPASVAWSVEKDSSGLLIGIELRNIPRAA